MAESPSPRLVSCYDRRRTSSEQFEFAAVGHGPDEDPLDTGGGSGLKLASVSGPTGDVLGASPGRWMVCTIRSRRGRPGVVIGDMNHGRSVGNDSGPCRTPQACSRDHASANRVGVVL